MTAADAPTVFVVDGDAGVRASILRTAEIGEVTVHILGTAQRHEDAEKM